MDLKLIYIMFFAGVFGCYAQKDSLQNSYFKSYDDKVTASLYYLDTSNNFQIVPHTIRVPYSNLCFILD